MHRTRFARSAPLASLLVALVALVALPACGGGNDDPDPAADRAAAQKANLKAADLPAGWNSKPHEKQPLEDALISDVAKCLGITAPSTRAIAQVRSPDFTSGLATASSVTTFVKSEDEATSDAAAFSGDKFAECATPGYSEQIHRTAPDGNTVSDVAITKIDLPVYGDRSVAHRLTGKINIPDLPNPVPITIDMVRIFKGRAEVDLTVVAPGQPFPEGFVGDLATAVVGRL